MSDRVSRMCVWYLDAVEALHPIFVVTAVCCAIVFFVTSAGAAELRRGPTVGVGVYRCVQWSRELRTHLVRYTDKRCEPGEDQSQPWLVVPRGLERFARESRRDYRDAGRTRE